MAGLRGRGPVSHGARTSKFARWSDCGLAIQRKDAILGSMHSPSARILAKSAPRLEPLRNAGYGCEGRGAEFAEYELTA
jgi:hypothetical protein